MFLGAGASVLAGMPTTKGLIDEVRDRVLNHEAWESREAKALAENIMTEHSKKDVEKLYERIHRMISAEKLHRAIASYKITHNASGPSRRRIQTTESPYGSDNITAVEETTDIDETIRALESLETAIRNTLLASLMVKQERFDAVVSTYNKLFTFVSRNIVTTNFDNVLEAYCAQAGLDLVDGFERSPLGDMRTWGDVWEDAENALHLLKLHGSTTWQKDDDGAVLQIGRPGLRSTDRDVMIAPTLGTKDYSDSIFPALLERFKKVLDETETLIVVGFSFRDPEITQTLQRHLRRTNKSRDPMNLLCVDPNLDGVKTLFSSNVETNSVWGPRKDMLWHFDSDKMPYVYAYQVEFGLDIIQSLENVLEIVDSEYEA